MRVVRSQLLQAGSGYQCGRVLCAAVLTATLVLGANLSHAAADSTVIVTGPAAPYNWTFSTTVDGAAGQGTGSYVTGPAPNVPMGVGSAYLSVTDVGREILYTDYYAVTLLKNITNLQYSTYTNNVSHAATLQFDILKNKAGASTNYSRLVFEPSAASAGAVVADTWQTWHPFAVGKWWLSHPEDVGGSSCSQALPCTWAELLTAFPDATFGRVLLKVGGPWAASAYNADQLVVGVNNDNTTFDFEPSAGPGGTATPEAPSSILFGAAAAFLLVGIGYRRRRAQPRA